MARAASTEGWWTARPALMWVAAIVVGGAIHLALWPLSEPPTLFSDFMKAYWVAAEHLWNGGLSAGYPFTVPGNWSNLPIVAWAFTPLVPLGREAAGWTYLAVGAAATLGAWALLVRVAGLRAAGAAALLFLFLLNGPLLNTLREGNSTHIILLLMAAGLAFWSRGREFAAGAAFGLCAVVKLPLLLLGVLFFFRRRWMIVAGGATTLGLTALLSLAIFGVTDHVEWFSEAVQPYLGKALPAFNVQSIDGFIIRLYTGAEELLYWGQIEPTALHKLAKYSLYTLLLGGFAWLAWRSERQGLVKPEPGTPQSHDLLQFSMVVALALVISPISWTHYYALLLVPLSLYMGGRLGLPDDAATRSLFWTGYALASLPVIMPAMQIDPVEPYGFWAELAARTVVSAWLVGALLLIAVFARGMWMATREAADMPSGERLRTA